MFTDSLTSLRSAFAAGGNSLAAVQALVTLLIIIPVAAFTVEWILSSGISERHHSNHNTYVISRSMSRVLVLAMAFMGILGIFLSWLCFVGVFDGDALIMLSFFSSFVLVMFLMWLVLRHYRVMTYDDHMEIRPFIGRTRYIRYADIEHLRWSTAQSVAGGRSVAVVVDGQVAAVLLGSLDLEQILVRINRDDVVEHGWAANSPSKVTRARRPPRPL